MWSPLAGGLLSGKYHRDQKPEGTTRQLVEWNEPPVYDEEALYRIVDELVAIADDRLSPADLSLIAPYLRHP
ncbi:hypothetical protein [Sodalis glossinidius]|uniref:hypothetical protein n=1 Tax=Sodalis glossinidius TaxID=63612 RepID=UPI0002EA0EF2|nr:hypothetical protein [Sodalis glossinidius]